MTWRLILEIYFGINCFLSGIEYGASDEPTNKNAKTVTVALLYFLFGLIWFSFIYISLWIMSQRQPENLDIHD